MTVLIAAYNAAGFLRRAVLSALSQSAPILEALIVDDASTDETLSVARQLASMDKRVRVLALERNGGPSVARNAGLDAAAGEWVAVLDADDAYLPDRLERMLAAATHAGADIVVDNFRLYDAATQVVGPPMLGGAEDAVESISFSRFLAQARPYNDEPDWGLLKPIFRKRFLQEQQLRYPSQSRHGEDFLLLVEAFLHGARYVLCRRAGYLYTDRNSGFSRTTINYATMVQHSGALLSDARIQGDALWVQRLHERIVALKQLAAEHDIARYWHTRDYISVMRRTLLESEFRKMLGAKVGRKIRNAL